MMRVVRASLWMLIVLAGCGQAREGGSSPASGSGAARAADLEMQDREGSSAASAKAAAAPRIRIKQGSITLRVARIREAEASLRSATRGLGGYVDALQGEDLDGPMARLNASIRVPVARFDEAFVRLGAIGTPISRQVQQEDVTEQVVDIDARAKVLRAEESAYVDMLRQARTIKDILNVRTRLSEVRQTIESAQATRLDLTRRAALSRIDVTFVSVPPSTTEPRDPNWSRDALSGATAFLGGLLRALATLVIYLGVLAPLWVPAVALWIYLHRKRAKARRGVPPKVQ